MGFGGSIAIRRWGMEFRGVDMELESVEGQGFSGRKRIQRQGMAFGGRIGIQRQDRDSDAGVGFEGI